MEDMFSTWAPKAITATAFTSSPGDAVTITTNRAAMVLQPTTACYIKFGPTAASVHQLAAVTDTYFAANEPIRFNVYKDSAYMSILRVSADGTLKWYLEHN